MMFAILGNPEQIVVILVIALVLFGAKRLPELARSLGQGVREFRKSVKEVTEEPEETRPEPPSKTA